MTMLFEQFRSFIPAADVVATDDEVTVVMDVPGFKSDDLQIELVDNVLTIRGERTLPYDEKPVWQRLERGFGTFERVLQVSKGLDSDSIEAELADGVLTLHIPVVTPTPKRIEIGGSQATIEQGSTVEEKPSEERELVGGAA